MILGLAHWRDLASFRWKLAWCNSAQCLRLPCLQSVWRNDICWVNHTGQFTENVESKRNDYCLLGFDISFHLFIQAEMSVLSSWFTSAIKSLKLTWATLLQFPISSAPFILGTGYWMLLLNCLIDYILSSQRDGNFLLDCNYVLEPYGHRIDLHFIYFCISEHN